MTEKLQLEDSNWIIWSIILYRSGKTFRQIMTASAQSFFAFAMKWKKTWNFWGFKISAVLMKMILTLNIHIHLYWDSFYCHQLRLNNFTDFFLFSNTSLHDLHQFRQQKGARRKWKNFSQSYESRSSQIRVKTSL